MTRLYGNRMTIEHAKVSFSANGTPISNQFDDIYFSDQDGLDETQYVFLHRNQLPERWQNWPAQPFTIYETGFGSGLNFLSTWQALDSYNQNAAFPIQLKFLSFERYPLTKDDLSEALSRWPQIASLSQILIEQYPNQITGDFTLQLSPFVSLTLLIGDVNEKIITLGHETSGQADAWFLDGFAPSKNPDMWSQNLFNNMARLSRQGTTIATFTAAGFVRRGLIDAGFTMRKYPGFGTKREMLAGSII